MAVGSIGAKRACQPEGYSALLQFITRTPASRRGQCRVKPRNRGLDRAVGVPGTERFCTKHHDAHTGIGNTADDVAVAGRIAIVLGRVVRHEHDPVERRASRSIAGRLRQRAMRIQAASAGCSAPTAARRDCDLVCGLHGVVFRQFAMLTTCARSMRRSVSKGANAAGGPSVNVDDWAPARTGFQSSTALRSTSARSSAASAA